MTQRQLVLASTSIYRQALLKQLETPFTVTGSDVDETALPGETPEALVVRLAELKARAVTQQFPNAIIIGADEVGVIDDEILGKPITHENAVKQLELVSGRQVDFLTGLAVIDQQNNFSQVALETYSVVFRTLTPSMIANYLKKADALQCAGSFKAEGLGIALVERFLDTDFSALIGLPLLRLIKMLDKIGFNIV